MHAQRTLMYMDSEGDAHTQRGRCAHTEHAHSETWMRTYAGRCTCRRRCTQTRGDRYTHTDRKTGRCVHTEGGTHINIQGESHEYMHVDTEGDTCVCTHMHIGRY